MPRHRKTRGKKGGGIFGPDDPTDTRTLYQRLTGAPKTPPPPPPPPAQLPAPIQEAVKESQEMAQTAGRRIKKHTGYNPASGKSMRKLFGTAKGDNMLGGKRRRRTHRR